MPNNLPFWFIGLSFGIAVGMTAFSFKCLQATGYDREGQISANAFMKWQLIEQCRSKI